MEDLLALPYVGALPSEKEKKGIIVNKPEAFQGYTLYTIGGQCRSDLIDLNGRVVKSWSAEPCTGNWHNAELLAGGDLLVVNPSSGVVLLTWDGMVRSQYSIPHLHHDVEMQPNGDIAVLTFASRSETINDARVLDCEVVRFSSESGALLGRLSLFNALSKNRVGYRLLKREVNSWKVEDQTDLFHANSVEWVRGPSRRKGPVYQPGNVLVSIRHQDAVVILKWNTQELVWSWGHGELSGPHDATMLDNGNVLIFDNGVSRGWSRAVEVDPISGNIVWQYTGNKELFTLGRGSAQRLPNGNTLLAISDVGQLIEVTSQGEVVWEYWNPAFDGKSAKRWHFSRARRFSADAPELARLTR